MNNDQTPLRKFDLRNSQIQYVRGKGKNSGKPYRALMLTVGEWSNMIFVESKFEMDYIEKMALSQTPERIHDDTNQTTPPTSSFPEGKTILDDEDDTTTGTGIFD